MSVKALQDYTFTAKYAQYDKTKQRRNTYLEAVEIALDMHLRRYAKPEVPEIKELINWSSERYADRLVLGSQRALQYAGSPIERRHARIYNCTASHCNRHRFFQESFWLLLCGCGVGFSVQKHHIAQLPEIHPVDKNDVAKVIIPDNIEGWADALGVLLASYMETEEYSQFFGKYIEFVYDEIREKGSPLSSGGKAPGPDGLRKALEKIRALMDVRIMNHQLRLEPIDAYDIVMHASDAVLSGGIRRSATICVFSPDDIAMLKAKTGNWLYTNPQRGRSNNSALLLRGSTTQEQFHALFESVRQFGEPAFVWADSTEIIFNPCVEIGLYPIDTTTGQTGWQVCNLCEINGKKCTSLDKFLEAAKAGAIMGTLQAGYTDFPYLGEVSERIIRREALLGVSITGIMDNPDILLNPEYQRLAATTVKETNKYVAQLLGINQAARNTCVKPAGSTSCILGTSSGIHPYHHDLHIRNVQANVLEAPYQYFAAANPRAVQASVWSANKTDAVISFCIEVPKSARIKKDVTALQLLKNVLSTQQNWVEGGKNPELCVQPYLSHNVSNTISVKENEWAEVEQFIYENRAYFAGVSLLPESGDLDYPQAPFISIHTPAEIVKRYGDGSMMASGLIVDGLAAFEDNLWVAVDHTLGVLELATPEEPSRDWANLTKTEFSSKFDDWSLYAKKIDWIRRAKQFADRYFEGDMRRMSYCLKEVFYWKLWCDLKREYVNVDYSKMIEYTDETEIQGTIACAGGACAI